MKFRIITTACAALVLAGCNNSSDEELSGEALEMDDVAAAVADMDMLLSAGQYQATTELVEFSVEGMPPEVKRMAEQSFAEEGAKGHSYCISEDMTPEQWISQMNESECTVSSVEQNGAALNAVLQCNDTEGMNGRVEMSGTADGTSSDMEIRFAQQIPGVGEAKMHLKMKSERTGDCT